MQTRIITRSDLILALIRTFIGRDGHCRIKLANSIGYPYAVDDLAYAAHYALRRNPKYAAWFLPTFAPVSAVTVARALYIAAHRTVMERDSRGNERLLEFPHSFLQSVDELDLPPRAKRYLAYHGFFYLGDLVAVGDEQLARYARRVLGWNRPHCQKLFRELTAFPHEDRAAWPLGTPPALETSWYRPTEFLQFRLSATELTPSLVARLENAGFETIGAIVRSGYMTVRSRALLSPSNAAQLSRVLAGFGFVFDMSVDNPLDDACEIDLEAVGGEEIDLEAAIAAAGGQIDLEEAVAAAGDEIDFGEPGLEIQF